MSKKTGGPAYLQDYEHHRVIINMAMSGELTANQAAKAAKELSGITVRDYFAAKAMQALFDSDAGHSTIECAMIANESYAMADAMLEARES